MSPCPGGAAESGSTRRASASAAPSGLVEAAAVGPKQKERRAGVHSEPETKRTRFGSLAEVGPRQVRRHVQNVVEPLSGLASEQDAAEVLVRAIRELQNNKWAGLVAAVCKQLVGKAESESLESACGRCPKLVAGLNDCPGFAAKNPPDKVGEIRKYIDRLLRSCFESKKEVDEFGYHIGRIRWEKAVGTEDLAAKRGRPSKVNDAESIKAVKAALEHHSQDSSKICQNSAGEWAVSRTLTRDRVSIYDEEEALYRNMSISTFSRIMKHHLKEYKKARCKSDMCQYCLDYDRKVLPLIDRREAEFRSQLQNIMPTYFDAWDAWVACAEARAMADRPALHLEALEHYISRHHAAQPCARHRGTEFPCGLGRLRERGTEGGNFTLEDARLVRLGGYRLVVQVLYNY